MVSICLRPWTHPVTCRSNHSRPSAGAVYALQERRHRVSVRGRAISGRDCAAHDRTPLRYRGGQVSRLWAAGARTTSLADFRCSGSGHGATRGGGTGAGRDPQQADGAVVRTYAAGVGLWLRAEGEWWGTVPGAGADRPTGPAHLRRAGARRPASGGERAGRNRMEGRGTPAVDACGGERAGNRVCHSAGRGYEQSVVILGEHYRAFLVHDGWSPYYGFVEACHQSCLRHLLVRCTEMAQIASPTAATFPLTIHHLLQTSLQLRDRYQQGEVSEHGLRIATGRLEAQLDRLLERSYRDPANRRLAKHLRHEQPYLFTFLHCPGLDATNHQAEQAVRWMVIARKVWGGNRTWAGAQTQQILVSIMRTCWQQERDAFPYLILLQRSRDTHILDIVPAAAQAAALLESKTESRP